jgi:hypothetical protein
MIYVVRVNVVVLFRSICSSHFKLGYQIDLLIFDPSFVLRIVSIRFDPLIPLEL